MKQIAKLIFYLLLSAINYNMILLPFNIVVGGTQGLAIVLTHFINISPSSIILLINIVMFCLCFIMLDQKVTKGIVLITFFYPFLLKLTSFLTYYSGSKKLVSIIISGILSGISLGNILKMGYSSGGLNVITLIFKKYFNIKEYLTNLVLNTVIIIIGAFLFSINNFFMALLVIIINSFVIRFILKDVNICK